MTKVLTCDDLAYAADLLKRGEVVAFPTETVYGLGASIFQPQAISKIFTVKGRPSDNPLIAHVSNFQQIAQIAQDIPQVFYALAEAFFPGPLTVVLRKKSCVPHCVSAGLDSIALRMPRHPVALGLIEALGEPIVAPSANLSGKPSSILCQHVLDDFSGKIAAVIDGGKTEYGIESTVISLIHEVPVLLRPGAISVASIEKVTQVIKQPVQEGIPIAPGMKYRHYAPKAPITLFFNKKEFFASPKALGTSFVLSREPLQLPDACQWFPLNTADFYGILRQADASNCQSISIICDEPILQNHALMNRILKASGNTNYST